MSGISHVRIDCGTFKREIVKMDKDKLVDKLSEAISSVLKSHSDEMYLNELHESCEITVNKDDPSKVDVSLQITPKSCPFCWSKKIYISATDGLFSVHCSNCRAKGPGRKQDEMAGDAAAVVAWNMR